MDTPATPPPPASEAPSLKRPGFPTGRALQTVISVAILIATLFTLWTPGNLFSNNLTEKMALALLPNQTTQPSYPTPSALPAPRIGIVAGHSGKDTSGKELDPGAVCQDGLTEQSLNLKIATLVKQNLEKSGFQVDLLDEFDKRLVQYQALVLVSIHNDSCDYINDEATGFKVAAALNSAYPDKSNKLVACLTDRYQKATALRFHYNSITPDMTQYHAFNEINSSTIAAVIETGFMNLDRQILTEHTDVVARGVSEGILCYVHNENVTPTATPAQP